MNDELITQIVAVTKSKLGITHSVRDTLLTHIAKGVVDELKHDHSITVTLDSSRLFMFAVDLSTWRYQSVDDAQTVFTQPTLPMPRHLQYRLHQIVTMSGDV